MIFTRHWIGRGFWAIADQGLFASSNFLLNIFLARWMSLEEYGAFAVAYSLFLLLGSLHTAMITEPMLVYSSGRFQEGLENYFQCLMWCHRGFIVLSCVLVLSGIALAWVIAETIPLLDTLLSLAIASPFLLTLWMFRRMCYVRGGPHLAAQAGAIYMILQLGGIFVLNKYEVLHSSSAFGLLAIVSFLSASWLIFKLKVLSGIPAIRSDINNALIAHWDYGRWAIGTYVFTWIPGNIYFLVLPVWADLEASGALRAIFNLLMPILHIFAALGNILIPSFVKFRTSPDYSLLVWKIFALFLIAAILYLFLLNYYGDAIIEWMYQETYKQYGNTLLIIGLLPFFFAVVSVFGSALKASEKPQMGFLSFLLSSISTLTLGMWLVAHLQVEGASMGWVVSYAIAGGTVLVCFLKQKGTYLSKQRVHA